MGGHSQHFGLRAGSIKMQAQQKATRYGLPFAVKWDIIIYMFDKIKNCGLCRSL